MDQKQTKTSNLRPLWLTAALCVSSIAAALDIGYGVTVLGHMLLMVMLGIYAVIFMTCERYVAVLNAIAVFAILFFTSRDPSLALFGAVILIAAMILSVFVRKKCTKTTAVLTVTLCVSIGYLAVIAIFYGAEGNSLLPSDILNHLNDYFESLKASLADVVRMSFESLPEETLKIYESYGYTQDMLITTGIENMEFYVDYLQMLLPGLLIALFQFMAFFALFAFTTAVRIARCEAIFPEPRWIVYPTQVSCVVYMITLFLYVIVSFFAATSTVGLIVSNFWLVLMPTMLICGFRSLAMRLKHPRFRRQTIIILVLFVIGFFFFAEAALELGILMLTFIGVQDVSASRAVESRFKKPEDE